MVARKLTYAQERDRNQKRVLSEVVDDWKQTQIKKEIGLKNALSMVNEKARKRTQGSGNAEGSKAHTK